MSLPAHHPFKSAKAKEEYIAIYERQAKLWPAESESRMIETSYGQTFVRINGAENAQPLVLLPGRYANSLSWTSSIVTLSNVYRTYAVDSVFDVGRSIPTKRVKNTDDLTRWLDELFTGLDFREPFRLMGISFGGWLSCLYAIQFSKRLDKMAVLAPVATVLPLSLEYWARGFLAILHPRFFKSLSYWMFEDFARKGKAAREILDQDIADLRAILRCVKLEFGLAPTVLKDTDLKSLQVPTLYMVGEHEKIYSAQKAVQRLNTIAPQIKTEVIPSSGHDLVTTQNEMVIRKVLKFFK